MPAKAPDGQRIAKLLARAGIASRRDVERMIAEGRVAKDGVAIDTPATLLASLRGITVDGVPVREPAPARLFRYHKPAGLLTAARDPRGRATIYDRLPRDLPRLMPVGRLDLNTEGLLLLTTDGELKRQLELPSTGVTRSYRARAFGDVSQEQLEELIHGVEIEGVRYGSIDANLERRTGRNQWIEMRLTEGKNREVRRVLEYLGLQVSRLIRTAYGPFHLADMPPGAVDEIRQHELVEFRKSLKGGAPTLLPEARDPSPYQGSSGRPSPGRAEDRRGRSSPDDGGARPAQPGGRVKVAPSGRASARTKAPPSPLAGSSGRPSPRRAEDSRGLSSPDDGGRPQAGRERGRAASAAQETPRNNPPRPARAESTRRIRTGDDKTALHHRPPPGSTVEGATPDKAARPKRGAGWAKAKPKPNARPSSRPTRRGTGKAGPTKGRPGPGKS